MSRFMACSVMILAWYSILEAEDTREVSSVIKLSPTHELQFAVLPELIGLR